MVGPRLVLEVSLREEMGEISFIDITLLFERALSIRAVLCECCLHLAVNQIKIPSTSSETRFSRCWLPSGKQFGRR